MVMKRFFEELVIWFCIFNNITLFLYYRCFNFQLFIFFSWWIFTEVITFIIVVTLMGRMFEKKILKLEDEVLHGVVES